MGGENVMMIVAGATALLIGVGVGALAIASTLAVLERLVRRATPVAAEAGAEVLRFPAPVARSTEVRVRRAA